MLLLNRNAKCHAFERGFFIPKKRGRYAQKDFKPRHTIKETNAVAVSRITDGSINRRHYAISKSI